mgnify:CR=1 FL=1
MEVENAFFPGHCDTKILCWIGTGTVTLSRGKGLDNNITVIIIERTLGLCSIIIFSAATIVLPDATNSE